jgi:hypothetical protein
MYDLGLFTTAQYRVRNSRKLIECGTSVLHDKFEIRTRFGLIFANSGSSTHGGDLLSLLMRSKYIPDNNCDDKDSRMKSIPLNDYQSIKQEYLFVMNQQVGKN